MPYTLSCIFQHLFCCNFPSKDLNRLISSESLRTARLKDSELELQFFLALYKWLTHKTGRLPRMTSRVMKFVQFDNIKAPVLRRIILKEAVVMDDPVRRCCKFTFSKQGKLRLSGLRMEARVRIPLLTPCRVWRCSACISASSRHMHEATVTHWRHWLWFSPVALISSARHFNFATSCFDHAIFEPLAYQHGNECPAR